MTELAEQLCRELQKQPMQFHELVTSHKNVSWPVFLRAWGELRDCDCLIRNEDGSYSINANALK